MENQINVGDKNSQQIGQNPISQPAQMPKIPKTNYWMISTLILVFLLIGISIYVLTFRTQKSNINIVPTVTTQDTIFPSPIPTTSPTTIPCNTNDKSFCSFLETIKQIVKSENFQTLVNYQKSNEITCDDKARAAQGLPTYHSPSLCKDIPEGGKTKGYSIGYNQSEGSTMTAQEYVETLKSYFAKNKPFKYIGNIVIEDKGYIVYANANEQFLFALPTKKYGSDWKIERPVLGVVSTDFTTLNPVILNYI